MRWFLNKKKILVSALWSTLSYDADAGFQQKLRGADESRGDEDYALMTTFDHTLRGAEENDEDYASMITFDRNLQFAKEFCWLPSATRGIGFIPQSCLEGYERIGLFCYKECPDEMQRWGFDCHSVCSDKFVDDGLFCRLPWYPTYFFFTQTDCESSHGSGNCEENCLAWYSKCPDGTTRQGCFDCIPNKPDCAALGLGDPVFDWSCTKFVEFGTPEIGTCPTGYEIDAGLCYYPCPYGYTGIGPVCWASPPPGPPCGEQPEPCTWVACGMGAAVDDLTCARIIFDQIFSVLNAIYTTVDTFTTGGAASAGQNAADKVEDTSKSSNKIAEAGKKAAAELTKVKESVLNFYKKFPTIKKGVEKVTDTADKFNDKLNKLFGIKDKSKFLGFEKMKLVKLETKAKLAASYAWKMKTFVDWTNKTSQVDEHTPIADCIRLAASAISLADPHGFVASWMGVIQAYSYPLCSEYFPGYTDLIEDVYTIEIECNVLSTNRRLGVEKGNNDKESESVNTDDILFSLSNDEIVVAMMPFNVSSCQGGAITEIEIKHERNIEQCAATELLVAATSTELASTEVASITITINKAKGGKSYRYDGMETLVPDSTPEDELNNTTNLIGFEFGSDTELSCNSTIQGPKTPEGVQGGGPDYALNGEECSALKICEWGMSCLVNGRCTDGQHGSECIIDGDCEKGRCVGELLETGTCEALLPIGSSCSLASSCETDICHEGKCAEPAKLGEECWAWIPCANALECMAVVQKCSDRKNGSPCALRAQCESNACLDNTCVPLALNGEFCGPERVCDAGLACLAFQQKCTNGNIGSPCVLPSDCDAPACINNKCAALAKNGESCGAGLQCEYGLACLAIQQKCTNGNIGSPCVLPSDCDVPACIKNKCAALAKNGESCGAGLQCESGLACLAFQQKCTNGSDGSFCNVDADCNSGRCASGKCGPKVGSCGSCGSGSHCISGKCYLRSTKMVCAESDGKMANDCYCDLDSHCQSGRCEGSWPPYQCHSKLGDGSGCDENSDCTSGLCASGKCTTYAYNGQSCWAGRPCASGLACLAFHQKCTDGRSGSLCNAAWDCDSGWCWASKCD